MHPSYRLSSDYMSAFGRSRFDCLQALSASLYRLTPGRSRACIRYRSGPLQQKGNLELRDTFDCLVSDCRVPILKHACLVSCFSICFTVSLNTWPKVPGQDSFVESCREALVKSTLGSGPDNSSGLSMQRAYEPMRIAILLTNRSYWPGRFLVRGSQN
jgi:hypothetical protein